MSRQPLALSLAGFQFTYRSSYFDWRLLHGIDVDTVIRLTDVKAVEDCLDTLQHGCFGAERDRLSPANCVQLFRLLQLAVEYCGHLRAAHALLLDCYNGALAAAENWKAAARSYLDAGGAFVAESLAAGALSRQWLEAADGAKAGLEAADREYNATLDSLEAEDSRARHFRFRKHRTELSWAALHAADPDRLTAELDVGRLEGLLPNLTFGSITAEDDEQLTPHHFAQLIPLAQAALDYVLWQANATGTLLEQAMSGLQVACSDIPTLTTATQEMHSNITALLLEAQHTGAAPGTLGGVSGALLGLGGPGGSAGLGSTVARPHTGGYGGVGSSLEMGGGAGPWAGSVDLTQSQALAAGGRPGTGPPQPLRASTPSLFNMARAGSAGGAQVLRLDRSGPAPPSRMGSGGGAPTLGPGGMGLAAGLGLSPRHASGSLQHSGMLEEMLAAAQVAGIAPPGVQVQMPVMDLQTRTAELSYKVEGIEHELRMERSKTEEMRRILADVRERLNQGRGGQGGPYGYGALGLASAGSGGSLPGGGGSGEGSAFPAASTTILVSPAGAGGSSAFLNPNAAQAAAGPGAGGGGGGITAFGSLNLTSNSHGGAGPGGRAGPGSSTAGVSLSPRGPYPEHSPAKVRVFVDEDAIREQERRRAVDLLTRQAENLKQQMLREHQERRAATSAATASVSRELQALLGGGGGGGGGGPGPGGVGRLQQDAVRHSRTASRDGSRRSVRHSSPSGGRAHGRTASATSASAPRHRPGHSRGVSGDFGSDPDLAGLSLGLGGPGGWAPDPRSSGQWAPGSPRGSGPKYGGGGFAGPGGGGGGGPGPGGGGGGGGVRPPKPMSRLAGSAAVHGSLGDLPSAAALGLGGERQGPAATMPGSRAGGGGGGGGWAPVGGGRGGGGGGGSGQRRLSSVLDSGEDMLGLPGPGYPPDSPRTSGSFHQPQRAASAGSRAGPGSGSGPGQAGLPPPLPSPPPQLEAPSSASLASAAARGVAFGSISLVGPAAEQAAAVAAAAGGFSPPPFRPGTGGGPQQGYTPTGFGGGGGPPHHHRQAAMMGAGGGGPAGPGGPGPGGMLSTASSFSERHTGGSRYSSGFSGYGSGPGGPSQAQGGYGAGGGPAEYQRVRPIAEGVEGGAAGGGGGGGGAGRISRLWKGGVAAEAGADWDAAGAVAASLGLSR
ncbi:hypothetical protein HYH03_009156 [Edaphochlamys debaryana]|uniref:Cilium assembly protein DZIP1 N-terminal domain-containing protein n=1 Tax=Edaphochlamys debaryana TaxID=47281 RepID=A0A836BX91_9CHLO|nr:hypothetical protein HYH03_009156 [Edaphochlamys debaryana]|eukprot:KAG2492491.1 hypothetical protein HYH03_009156 [Edaphochlamys debaryana]